MATAWEYLERTPTNQLDAILAQEAFGRETMPLSAIYVVCAILAGRKPARGSAKEIFLEFACRYAESRQFSTR